MPERGMLPEPLDLQDLEILLAIATVFSIMLNITFDILDGMWTVPLSSLITVAIVDKIIKDDLARRGWERSREENGDFLKFLCENRIQFIQLAAPLAHKERWDNINDTKILIEISTFGLKLLDGIVHEQDNLNIHSSLIKGYLPPIVESRKDEYLYSLRQLRIATRDLMLAIDQKDRRKGLKYFEIARGDAINDRDLLIKALYKSSSPKDVQDLCKGAGFGPEFFADIKNLKYPETM